MRDIFSRDEVGGSGGLELFTKCRIVIWTTSQKDAMSTATFTHAAHSVEHGALCDSELHRGLDAHLYHSSVDLPSCSLLKAMLISPAHYQAQLLARHTKSAARDCGTLVHALVLEPGTFSREFAVFPGKRDGRDSDFKAFLLANAGRSVIDELELDAGRRLAEKILHRQVMGRPFGDLVSEGTPEASIYYTDPATGIRCRVRIDLLHPEGVFDLKTTMHPTASAWLRQALSLHYDMQSYMYVLAVSLLRGATTPPPFVFVAAENEMPHSVSVYPAGSTFIENGGKKYQTALGGYAACSKVGYWPDASSDAVLEINHWQAMGDKPSWAQETAP
jgi:hypothetical protein